MSKRSRQEFEGPTSIDVDDGVRKRRKSEGGHTTVPSMNNSEFECPVCYEDFTDAIYQCVEGHLLCHQCRPQFTLCPTCRVSLETNIRNRILEQILHTKSSKVQKKTKSKTNAKEAARSTQQHSCNSCHKSFDTKHKRDEHFNHCVSRLIRCPFIDCNFLCQYSKWLMHAQETHHTSNGSKQASKAKNNKMYTFHHAIKFPQDTLTRKNADFVWPKIVQFDDGKQFFILSRFNQGFITIFVRLMRLYTLQPNEIKNYLKKNGEGDSLGNYWIEFKINSRDKNKNKNKNEDNMKEESVHKVPLRWPGDLYAITAPFDYEKRMHRILSVHHSIFTKYWTQPNSESSAVFRFQFQAVLHE